MMQQKTKNPIVAAIDGLYNRYGSKSPANTSESGTSEPKQLVLYSPETSNRRKIYSEYKQLSTRFEAFAEMI